MSFVLWKPRWAFVLVLMMFPAKQLLQLYVPFLRGHNQWGPNAAIALLAAFALVMRFVRRERPLPSFFNAATVFTLGLYGMTLVALTYSPAVDNALYLFGRDWAYQILLLFILPLLVDDVEDFRRMANGLIWAGLLLSLLVLLNPSKSEYGGRTLLDVGVQRSSSGKGGGNPLAMAEFGGILAIAGALIKFDRAMLPQQVLRGAAVLLGLGMAVSSGSRGQVMSAALVGVAFYPLARPMKNLKQSALMVIGLLLVAGVMYLTFDLFMTQAGMQRWGGRQWAEGYNARMTAISTLLNAWAAEPLAWVIGLGTNAYFALTGQGYVHNVAVEALGEEGLIGFGLFMGAAIAAAAAGRRLFRFYQNDPAERSAVAVLCGLAAYSTLTSLKQGCIITFPAPFYWWMVIGSIAKRESMKRAEASRREAITASEEQTVWDGGEAEPEKAPAGVGYAA